MTKGSCRILIADPDYRQYYQKILPVSDEDRVIVKSDHKKACEFFSRNPVDLALLSHRSHDVCLDTIRFCKTKKPLVPLIVLADRGSEAFAIAVFRMGVRDYIRKPVNPGELETSIRAALGILRPSEEGYDIYSPGRIDRAVQYIHDHYRSRLSLRDAARMAGMSTSHFCRFFKKETDMNFTNYVNNFRVAKAVDLLRQNGKSMSEIAFACGFTNQFHFSRVFKKFSKMSPVKLRKIMNSR
jgi:two-component system, response regulator YesN